LLSALSGSVTGTYAGIALSCDVREINAAKKESCVVTITVVDANGNIVKKNPLKEILLNIGGNARLVGNNPAKITKGIAKIKVQSTGVPGEIVVSASGSDLAVQPIKIMAVVPGMRTSQPEEEAQPEPPAEE